MRKNQTWREMWTAKGLKPVREDVYPYYNAKRQKIVRKTRFRLVSLKTGEAVDKTFVVRHCPAPATRPDEWKSGVGRYGSRLLYGLNAGLRAAKEGRDIYWPEGEKDAKNARTAFGIVAITHHQGSAGAKIGQAEWLAGTDSTVFLVMDNDKVGIQIAWHNAQLLEKVGLDREQIAFLLPAVDEEKADLSDHIKAGYKLRDLEPVKRRDIEQLISKWGELGSLNNRGGRFGSRGMR